MLEEEKKDQRNMMLALVLIIVVLTVFNRLTMKPAPAPDVPLENTQTEEVAAVEPETVLPEVPATVVAEEKNIAVKNDFVDGNLAAGGSRVNALNLIQYRQTTEPDSPAVELLNQNFYTNLNWVGSSLPDTKSTARVVGETLTPETPITLTWEKNGVSVERKITLDSAYLMTFTDTVKNGSDKAVSGQLEGQIIRAVDSVPNNRSTVHEGFLGLFDNKEKESRYLEIKDDKSFSFENQGGWIGQTDKYWQAIFVPDQTTVSTMKFEKVGENYVSSFKSPVTVAAGQSMTRVTKLFAGAKELKLINDYAEQGIPRFDLSIDFGWYYFLTKPFLYFLGWLYSLIGNMGVVILVFATLIRIALLPIATKSYESMAKMKKVQPKIKALQERFKDDKKQLQMEMMNLYKRDKVNPASGCLPMLIQIPVFFALYKVLSVSILMRQAPFFGWITDLSQPDPSSVFTAFGYLPWPIPSFLNIGVWPLLMGLTMVIQQRLSPSAATGKDQKMIMNMMPVIFTFMLGNFASGLVIYWTWSNILSIAQQKYIMKKVGA